MDVNYSTRVEEEKNTAESGVDYTEQYSLRIRHSNGTVEELADAREISDNQILNYLLQAKKGELYRESYIPVRRNTPQVIIDTLNQVNEDVKDLSMVMQVRKARQAMSDGNVDKRGESMVQITEAMLCLRRTLLKLSKTSTSPAR